PLVSRTTASAALLDGTRVSLIPCRPVFRVPLPFFSAPVCPPPISTLFPYPTLFRSVSSTTGLTGFLLELGPFGGGYTGEGAELRSEEHTSELQSHLNLVCRLLLEKKKQNKDESLRASRGLDRRAPVVRRDDEDVAVP